MTVSKYPSSNEKYLKSNAKYASIRYHEKYFSWNIMNLLVTDTS